MNKILSNTGITSGSIIEAHHVSQSIDALTGADGYDITISGSLTISGSIYFNNIPSNSGYNNVLTIDSTKILYTSSLDVTVNNALTASYIDLVAGDSITINQVGTSFEISSSAISFNSFTGSFTGSLLGTSSYVNLVEGPNITINQVGISFEISGSVESIDTGSFLVTASISSSTITFTKGDNSTFPIVIPSVNNSNNNLLNIFITESIFPNPYPWTAFQYQIPSGNCRIIIDTTTINPSNYNEWFLNLPTSSFSLGDVLEIIGMGPYVDYPNLPVKIRQSSTIQQISSIYNSAFTTIGLGHGVMIRHRDTINLTCIRSSSIKVDWFVTSYTDSYDLQDF